jgi:anion-transporting  ArsA/GET3 family ATPase
MTSIGWHQLARRRFLVVTGKGGVGKSAVACALGQGLAQRGNSVLVVEVDPRENVHQMFGVPPSGGEVIKVRPGLWVQNLKPRQALDELVRRQVGFDLVSTRVLASDSYNQMAEGTPGLKEVAVLSYVESRGRQESGGAGPFDTVILDAPATGHGVSLLAAPGLLWEVIESGPVGEKARELADFVADRERLGIVIVTQAEEMPVAESLELRATLEERLARTPELLVINGLYPPLPREVRDGEGAGEEARSALEAWYRRRRINEREMDRLAAAWPEARVELPLLPLERGPALVTALEEKLEGQLTPGARPARPGRPAKTRREGTP